jgi:hypothetical protein
VRIPAISAISAAGFLVLSGCNVSQSSTIGSAPIAAPAHVVPTTSNAPAEIFNQILPFPQPCQNGSGPCPDNFEVTFQGNQTGNIPSNEPLNLHENAFCNPSGSGNCQPTVTYTASTNTTTVEWSGPVLYHNRVSGKPGVHFGILAARDSTASIKSLEQASYWSYPSTPENPEPIISVNSKQPAKSSNWKYAVVYLAGSTTPGGSEYASWTEIAYVPNSSGEQPQFTFTNYGKQTIYVTSSGIVLDQSVPTDPACLKSPDCPENMTLLGDLQEVNYPPPGQPSSSFVALQFPPASKLKPK